ncbi:hypothetical protein JDS92_22635 [Bacillus cereus group sp. N12]|uniref:hypothetical protein n=1 Tax=Bacillus cereus group sp. N12 TaxID=2794586 RepID=UPI0018F68685|nr:hypothetical protein [Bacillus cereus group sp. N12]MBJ8078139.1 hypothetical protein [Bacillus cereus group sp. N12]
MTNQTKYTNTESPEQNFSLEGSPFQEPGARVCRGDIWYVCSGGRWKIYRSFLSG